MEWFTSCTMLSWRLVYNRYSSRIQNKLSIPIPDTLAGKLHTSVEFTHRTVKDYLETAEVSAPLHFDLIDGTPRQSGHLSMPKRQKISCSVVERHCLLLLLLNYSQYILRRSNNGPGIIRIIFIIYHPVRLKRPLIDVLASCHQVVRRYIVG